MHLGYIIQIYVSTCICLLEVCAELSVFNSMPLYQNSLGSVYYLLPFFVFFNITKFYEFIFLTCTKFFIFTFNTVNVLYLVRMIFDGN